MNSTTPRLGHKVRSLRRAQGLSQSQLAADLGISGSYLNLIENNRRPLTARVLIKVAQRFSVPLEEFSDEEENRLARELEEVLIDPVFGEHQVKVGDARELAARFPEMARSMLSLFQAWKTREESLHETGLDVGDHRLPSEEVTELLQSASNHFPALEAAAEELRSGLRARSLADGLHTHLEEGLGVSVRVVRVSRGEWTVRRYLPDLRELRISEELAPRSVTFQLAHQIGLLTLAELMDEIIDRSRLSTEQSRRLGRVALANYFAGAVLMPYAAFLDAAETERYDIELLGNRFRTSFEQVCHRLTTLQRPGARGIPFHMVRVDIAGNISKRFSASGIHFARFSGACPRWNIHAAFLTPGRIRIQLSEAEEGARYFCVARTVSKGRAGYRSTHSLHAIGLGTRVEHARRMVYSEGVDVDGAPAVQIGVSCRLCHRQRCEQRAHPPLDAALALDENVRGRSFYDVGR